MAIDRLVLLYLKLASYHNTARVLTHESNIDFARDDGAKLPATTLQTLVRRGLLYTELEQCSLFQQDNSRAAAMPADESGSDIPEVHPSEIPRAKTRFHTLDDISQPVLTILSRDGYLFVTTPSKAYILARSSSSALNQQMQIDADIILAKCCCDSGHIIFATTDCRCCLIDIRTGELLSQVTLPGSPNCIDISTTWHSCICGVDFDAQLSPKPVNNRSAFTANLQLARPHTARLQKATTKSNFFAETYWAYCAFNYRYPCDSSALFYTACDEQLALCTACGTVKVFVPFPTSSCRREPVSLHLGRYIGDDISVREICFDITGGILLVQSNKGIVGINMTDTTKCWFVAGSIASRFRCAVFKENPCVFLLLDQRLVGLCSLSGEFVYSLSIIGALSICNLVSRMQDSANLLNCLTDFDVNTNCVPRAALSFSGDISGIFVVNISSNTIEVITTEHSYCVLFSFDDTLLAGHANGLLSETIFDATP